MTDPSVNYYTYQPDGHITGEGTNTLSYYNSQRASGVLIGLGTPKKSWEILTYTGGPFYTQMVDVSAPVVLGSEPVLIDRPKYAGVMPTTGKIGEPLTLPDAPASTVAYQTPGYTDFSFATVFPGGDYVLTPRVAARYAVIFSNPFPIQPFVWFVDVTE